MFTRCMCDASHHSRSVTKHLGLFCQTALPNRDGEAAGIAGPYFGFAVFPSNRQPNWDPPGELVA